MGDAFLLRLLEALSEWATAAEVRRRLPGAGSARDLRLTLAILSRRGVLEQESRQEEPWAWQPWWPEAAFFHFATANRTYPAPGDHHKHDEQLREKARSHPPPAPTKSMPGPVRRLPRGSLTGSLAGALVDRRTWRQFAPRPLKLPHLATLLHETFGVKRWATVPGQGRVVLKTSPSGGARHPVEAYVVAFRVADLQPGVYHYDSAAGHLSRLRRLPSARTLLQAIGNQSYFMRAAVWVVLTALVERVWWRYPQSRAFRGVLAEAGHLGQTFCLIASSLQLAPFCTMAFSERVLADILGVDEQTEPAIYIVGAGNRPRRHVPNPGRILEAVS